MSSIDPRAAEKLQPELLSGESIHWAGMPNPTIVFHSDDWYSIPFSLLWGGFAIFWEAGVSGYGQFASKSNQPSLFMILWGIPFVVAGQYMIWGRFIVDAWLKRRTYYAVSNRRVLILQEGWKRKRNFIFLESIADISQEGDGAGTIWLGPKYPVIAGRGRPSRSFSRFSVGEGVPILADVDDVQLVYRLILELRPQNALTESPFSYK
jgi:hypothetical protein